MNSSESVMTEADLRARREAILAAHLDGETAMDADAVLATMVEDATYDLITIDRVMRGHDEIRHLLELMFSAVPGIVHRGVRFHHADDHVIVEVETDFPNGFDGSTPGQVAVMKSVGVFPFDGVRSLGERVYSDMSPLAPYLDPPEPS